MGNFTSVGKVLKKVAPKQKPRHEKVCTCGHSKTMHESQRGCAELDQPPATICLLCDCADYRYGSRRKI